VKPCRECRREISEQAFACPHCGAPFPARAAWDGWGYEYKSRATLAGLPLLHVSFKYRANRMPVVARGVVAIGQFACGIVCIAQFSVGLLSISQFTLAAFAVAQFAVAYSLIAQIGIYLAEGRGQLVFQLSKLLSID
jgi:hypothetical protein